MSMKFFRLIGSFLGTKSAEISNAAKPFFFFVKIELKMSDLVYHWCDCCQRRFYASSEFQDDCIIFLLQENIQRNIFPSILRFKKKTWPTSFYFKFLLL